MASSVHRGDGGETQLWGGQRVRKDDARIECVGSIDELSSFLGLARAVLAAQGPVAVGPEAEGLATRLARIQHELYLVGGELARPAGAQPVPPTFITVEHVHALDREIEQTDASLPKLRAFILPAGGELAAHLHVARAVCRRVERQVVALAALETLSPALLAYLNRLSLALFSMARQAASICGRGDEPA